MSDCHLVPGWNTSNCCISCHEDHDEYGYWLCSGELNGKEIEICCKASIFLDSHPQEKSPEQKKL